MIFITMMVLGGIFGLVLGSAKNRSALGWGVLCFLLPIFVILLMAMPALPPKVPKTAEELAAEKEALEAFRADGHPYA